MDRLAADSVNYCNPFTVYPICTPSRYEGGKINIRGVPFSEVVGQAQKKTGQNLGATKVLTADEQPSSATVNNSEASNNTFDFPYATSEPLQFYRQYSIRERKSRYQRCAM